MADEKNLFCAFPHAVGLDRVLQMQKFRPECENDDTKVMYSLPYPGKDTGLACNIVILGKPGTLKSTLALEMASRLRIVEDDLLIGHATKAGETATVIYYSLEQSPKSLIRRHGNLKQRTAVTYEGPTKDDPLWVACSDCKGSNAKLIVERNTGGHCLFCYTKQEVQNRHNLILFPQLSPRRLEQTGERQDDESVFWQRLSEIRNLVERLQENNKDKIGLPKLRMVIIDSLNVFGDRPISRYLLEQLFAFFVEKELVGVFVAEDPEAVAKSMTEEPHVSLGIANIADVVIKMQWETSEGYCSRGIEIEKSRFTSNIYGIQQMKVRSQGIQVLPSIHSWYSFLTEYQNNKPINKLVEPLNRLVFKQENMQDILGMIPPRETVPSIICTLSGPKGSCKTPIAISYALSACGDLTDNEGKFLLVSLDVSPEPVERVGSFGNYNLTIEDLFDKDNLQIGQTKGRLSVVKKNEIIVGYQLWLAPGFLLAEELVHYLYKILLLEELKQVTRVVIQDIGLVPMRYPVIFRHINQHGNLFTVIMELMRKLRIDCMFVSGTIDANARKVASQLDGVSHFVISSTAEHKVTFSGRYVKDGRAVKKLDIEAGRYILSPIKQGINNDKKMNICYSAIRTKRRCSRRRP